jgi:hypothetical protein
MRLFARVEGQCRAIGACTQTLFQKLDGVERGAFAEIVAGDE